jgi:hypothetical protein
MSTRDIFTEAKEVAVFIAIQFHQTAQYKNVLNVKYVNSYNGFLLCIGYLS